MVPGVAELIAALRPHQLDTISREHRGALRLQDDHDFKARLLVAAREADEETSLIRICTPSSFCQVN
jgi:hypothetical protein